MAKFDALNEVDFERSNNVIEVGQVVHALSATHRSEEPVSSTTSNVCGLQVESEIRIGMGGKWQCSIAAGARVPIVHAS